MSDFGSGLEQYGPRHELSGRASKADLRRRIAELEAALVVERNLVTSAHRAENAKQKALDAERHRADAVQDDAQALVNKLHHVHDSAAYQAVWTLWQAHAGRYKGPQYTDELAALEARLLV